MQWVWVGRREIREKNIRGIIFMVMIMVMVVVDIVLVFFKDLEYW